MFRCWIVSVWGGDGMVAVSSCTELSRMECGHVEVLHTLKMNGLWCYIALWLLSCKYLRCPIYLWLKCVFTGVAYLCLLPLKAGFLTRSSSISLWRQSAHTHTCVQAKERLNLLSNVLRAKYIFFPWGGTSVQRLPELFERLGVFVGTEGDRGLCIFSKVKKVDAKFRASPRPAQCNRSQPTSN